MLGIVKPEPYWQYTAYGKHPAVKDYFSVGQTFSSMRSVSDWIEKGYQLLSAKKDNALKRCSWRFWARELQKESIVCGILRDSNDSFGRPYPLLVMGTGVLKDWEKNWDLIPYACENTWEQMEYLSTGMFSDLKQLEEEVRKIRPPHADLSVFASKRDGYKAVRPQNLTVFERQASKISQNAEAFICLDGDRLYDMFDLIGLYHVLIKMRIKTPPNAVFMGGTLKNTYLVLFKRPLVPSDFIQLWSDRSA